MASLSALFALCEAPDYIDSVHEAVRWMPPWVRSMASGRHDLRSLRGETLTQRELACLGTDLPYHELMRSWSRKCRYPPPVSLWSPAVRVVIDLHRGTSEKPAGAYWDGLLRRCGPRLTTVQRDWLGLFAADARGHLTMAVVASLMALDRRPEQPVSASRRA